MTGRPSARRASGTEAAARGAPAPDWSAPAFDGELAPPERWIGFGSVVLAGCGGVLAAGGWAAGDLTLAIGGAVCLAGGIGVLLAAHWVASLPLLALALVLPAPFATESFRLSAAVVATALVVAAWCLRRGVDGGSVRVGTLPRRPAAALLGAIALATVFAQSPVPAVREFVTFVLLLGLLVAATDELAGHPRLPGRLALLLAGVAGVVGPLAVLEAAGVLPGRFPLPGTGFNRATLGFGWPNELAMYFALSLPLAAYGWWTVRSAAGRWLAGAAVAGVVVGLAATFSRGSWLAVPAGAAALLLAGEWRLVVRIWGAAVVLAAAADLASGGAVTGRLGALPGDWVVEQRAALVLTGLIMFAAHPLVGVGPGGFGEHLEHFGPRVSWLWDYVGSAHNSYVHMAAEAGVIGLAAFVAFLGAVFLAHLRGARRTRRDGASTREPSSARLDGGTRAPFAGTATGSGPPGDRALRLALLWALGITVVLGMLEWILAHGVGQLVVLIAAMGFALDASAGGEPSPGEGAETAPLGRAGPVAAPIREEG